MVPTDYIQKLEETNKLLEANSIDQQKLIDINGKLKIILTNVLSIVYDQGYQQFKNDSRYHHLSLGQLRQEFEVRFTSGVNRLLTGFDKKDQVEDSFVVNQVERLHEELCKNT